MKKPFIVANVRDIMDLLDKGEITYSRMVEMLNEIAEKFYEPKWISVDDMLPDETCRCWCYCEEVNSLGISHYQWNCCYNKETKLFTDALRIVKVTHWQPLPNQPKTK